MINVWQLIANEIDDPETFRNFSLVCKMFSNVATILNPQKKRQFTKPFFEYDWGVCPCCGIIDEYNGFKLPNGNLHGEYTFYNGESEVTTITRFDNGREI